MDGLKSINDKYGHQMGDKFIIEASKLLSNVVRNEDVLARTGGDEFAIILPETDAEITDNICNRIKNESKSFNKNRKYQPTYNCLQDLQL